MEKLLKLLSDRGFHSGEEIGKVLGISRAGVWKKIKGLKVLGLMLDAVCGRGYRLAPGIELLDRSKIYEGLEQNVLQHISLHLCLVTSSTNDLIREVAGKTSDQKMHFCMAEHQTNGRGRRGRSWVTPFGGSICLSILWRVCDGTASLEGLSLAVGLAVVKALGSCGAQGLSLKWPNDVLWKGKKLSGVLLEVCGDPVGECEVTIGVGVNIRLSDDQFDIINQPATDLQRACGMSVSRNHVGSALIGEIYRTLECYKRNGFVFFQEQWNHYDAYFGKRVMLDVSSKQIYGRSLGVNEWGGIILETISGNMAFHSGEVSLRADDISVES
ncbi:MAG: bifunctional biotin--[acetyl-CoA-carboxylase] ligase/biotin operon repressor BirA [Candidatus Endonucleobacter bathymodioli]|uniref:Bifunctional ligase/repressor BirA n=1 Tax=Candidatus Endonucleibacter bathymodioli TaxID=539814 RepID=A0AA90NUQ2_9GAMM|nr:bifunctional biotin--[acetyl-CoA-carboxylase] ligase/biotin operon repressor BirA [Candidatus Endonucleobacter bathymodioli]